MRNLRDGSVEAEIEGTDAAVEGMLRWLGRGPRGAVVTAIEHAEVPPTGELGFTITH